MAEIPIIVSLATLTNYFFAAFILSYIAPKIRVGKMFWYGLVVFFFIIFLHNMEAFITNSLSEFSYNTLFVASFFLLISSGGLIYDRRIWLGEESKVIRTLLTPSEIRIMEKERKARESAVR